MCKEIKCRYNIDWLDVGNCTLRVDREYSRTEIAQVLGISNERVRQIEEQAMRNVMMEIVRRYRMIHPEFLGESSDA